VVAVRWYVLVTVVVTSVATTVVLARRRGR